MIEWKRYRTVTDDSVIRAVEQRTGRRLPPEYVQTALTHSGGVPLQRLFTVQEQDKVFNRLISLSPDQHPNLLDALAWAEHIPGRTVIPFATDVFGGLICFSFLTASFYSVVWADTETGAVTPIAGSFTDFLECLKAQQGGGHG